LSARRTGWLARSLPGGRRIVTTKLARALLVLGVTLGIAGLAAAALDLRISIPDWMIRVAMIKLALAGSLGLLGAGAVPGRHAKRQAARHKDELRELSTGGPHLDLHPHDREPAYRKTEALL
jgi:hypothetical protein